MKEKNKNFSRRQFITSSALGMAGLFVLPRIRAAAPMQDQATIRLGFIGLGQQAMSLLYGFNQVPGVEVVAGSDVYGIKRKRFENGSSHSTQRLVELQRWIHTKSTRNCFNGRT